MTLESNDIVIIGASGFIGKNLMPLLATSTQCEISILVHKNKIEWGNNTNISQIEGSLFNKDSLRKLIPKKAIIINLAYLADLSLKENTLSLENLLFEASSKGVERIIHVSTAVVSGRTFEKRINENSETHPLSKYEKNKKFLENYLINEGKRLGIKILIVRPTCVFGKDGKNLLKLVYDLKNKSVIIRYLKTCLYHRRTMNVVSVKDVCSVISFLINYPIKKTAEIFIVSDDDNNLNNYESIENIFINELGLKRFFFPVLKLPHILLSILLFLLRQSNIDPTRTFSRKKIEDVGWSSSVELDVELRQFIQSQKES